MIIITSASRGIGKFLFDKFMSKNEEVLGFYNNTVPTTLTKNHYKIDLTNSFEINQFYELYKNDLKNIILINTAGVSYNSFAHKANIVEWKKVFDINLFGSFNLISLLLNNMREDNYGRIINLGSVVGKKGVIGTSAYAASKSSLWGLSKAIAEENAQKNITINTINLGYFNIGMIKEVPENLLERIIDTIPAKRLGDPDEIFSTVNFIINNAYLNGSEINLNGGLF